MLRASLETNANQIMELGKKHLLQIQYYKKISEGIPKCINWLRDNCDQLTDRQFQNIKMELDECLRNELLEQKKLLTTQPFIQSIEIAESKLKMDGTEHKKIEKVKNDIVNQYKALSKNQLTVQEQLNKLNSIKQINPKYNDDSNQLMEKSNSDIILWPEREKLRIERSNIEVTIQLKKRLTPYAITLEDMNQNKHLEQANAFLREKSWECHSINNRRIRDGIRNTVHMSYKTLTDIEITTPSEEKNTNPVENKKLLENQIEIVDNLISKQEKRLPKMRSIYARHITLFKDVKETHDKKPLPVEDVQFLFQDYINNRQLNTQMKKLKKLDPHLAKGIEEKRISSLLQPKDYQSLWESANWRSERIATEEAEGEQVKDQDLEFNTRESVARKAK